MSETHHHNDRSGPLGDRDIASTGAAGARSGVQSAPAAFEGKYLARDVQAGIITGAMAIPLSVGIALMSDYPIKVALATVAFACFIGWINAFIRPGNYIGAPGVAAGLAPVLAMGVASFGMENMAFVIFLTAAMQALIWKFNWQKYILLAVPGYLVEGLLAGVGLKIALKFLTFTYEIPAEQEAADAFWNGARIQMALISLAGFVAFVYLFSKFKDTKPAVPYFLLIGASIVLAQFLPVPMLHVDDVELRLALPLPHFDSAITWIYVIGFAAMLAVIDVIEQVMSNAAIEKIDPLDTKVQYQQQPARHLDRKHGFKLLWRHDQPRWLGKKHDQQAGRRDDEILGPGDRDRGRLLRHELAVSGISAQVFARRHHDFLRVEDDNGTVARGALRAIRHDPGHGVRLAGL